MSLLCRLRLHRYRWLFVGDSWNPNAYVRACARVGCGQEPR